MGSIPGLGRSLGGGSGNLLQYSCQENPMDRGAWQVTVHRIAESDMTEHLSTYRSYCCCSVTELRPTPCDPVDYSTPGLLPFTISRSLLKFMSIESVMPSNHLILCCPLLLLPSVFPRIRIFSNKLALCIRWPKYWSFCFTISPCNEYYRCYEWTN